MERKVKKLKYGTSIRHTVVSNLTSMPGLSFTPVNPEILEEENLKVIASLMHTGARQGSQTFGNLPSVTVILSSTEDYTDLEKWQQVQVSQHGREVFNNMSLKRLSSGSTFHLAIETLLKELKVYGRISDQLTKKVRMELFSKADEGYLLGVLPFLQNIPKTEWMKVEEPVRNNHFCYKGKFDAIIDLNGKVTLIDWKSVCSSSTKKSSTGNINLYSMPLQIAMYIAAVNCDPAYSSLPKVTQGAIVLCYSDGSPYDIVIISEEELKMHYLELAKRLNYFWWKLMTSDADVVDFIKPNNQSESI